MKKTTEEVIQDIEKGREQVDYLLEQIDHRIEQLSYDHSIAGYWATLHLEALYQIVYRKRDQILPDPTTDPDFVIALMSMGYHDPTIPSERHDDETRLLAEMRSKRG